MAMYDTAVPYAGAPPAWLSGEDANRLNAYTFYSGLYKNDNTAFKITLREDEENPIYVPSAKRIVRTIARYVCKGLSEMAVGGTPEQQQLMLAAYQQLFTREEFRENFRDAMEPGIAMGDFALMIKADPNKPDLSKISLQWIDPAMVFLIEHPTDVDRIVGVRVIELLVAADGKQTIKLQRWLKPTSPDHPGYDETAPNYDAFITYEALELELTDWSDPLKRKIVRTIQPMIEIPGITQPPVYLFRNRTVIGEHYGQSEIQGLETLFLAINQAVTDEDVALAMQGLGVYVSNTRPTDPDTGESTDWVLGPRRVVEVSGPKAESYFERVSGVTSVDASQKHIDFLLKMAESTAGISDVALGQVDVSVAQSGIALALRMGPILDEADRKTSRFCSKLAQVYHDLKEWFSTYERINFPPEMEVEPRVLPPLPVDIDKERSFYQDLYVNGVIDTLTYVTKLNELGANLGDPAQVVAAADAERAKRAAENAEAYGLPGGDGTGDTRLEQEADGATPEEPEE